MSEDKALELFAHCYNRGDFAPVIRRLSKKCTLEWHDFFYKQEGRARVGEVLRWRAGLLNDLPRRNRAHVGYEMVKHDVFGMQLRPCLVLTDADDDRVLGIVSIRPSLLGIRNINVGNPEYHTYTRVRYAEEPHKRKGAPHHG